MPPLVIWIILDDLSLKYNGFDLLRLYEPFRFIHLLKGMTRKQDFLLRRLYYFILKVHTLNLTRMYGKI